MDKPLVGGQAVIEGVMMRGFGKVATAVRESDGNINVNVKPITSIADKYPVLKLPILRGAVNLFESLMLGMKSLSFSAQVAGDEDEQLSDRELIVTIILAIALACGLFLALPTFAAKFFHTFTDDPFYLNLAEGFLRLAIFLIYLFAISRTKDIQRVFEYHGAEHKTIFCYEADLPLTVENVKKFPRLHPRCGTAFLLIVMLVSIFVFAFLGWPELWLRIVSRIILLPLVAGLSYEIIRFSARSKNSVVRLATLPGLWLQYLTTREPDDSMIEVAIKSLEAVTPKD
ncbi:MAG: DUF1385 domain-containing protein [Selenomonadaceae bacterium]|nr:DUF1385 domain-containing protein [Selenomonadaceae bacterium]